MPETDPNQFDQPDDETVEDEGPDVSELEDDPAYNPDDDDLETVKGG
jgi:hypothetical protein